MSTFFIPLAYSIHEQLSIIRPRELFLDDVSVLTYLRSRLAHPAERLALFSLASSLIPFANGHAFISIRIRILPSACLFPH
jgi:hypothetical protein